MNLPDFLYLAPEDPAELASLLARHGERAKILAGGTDLIIALKERTQVPKVVIDISGLKDLAGIEPLDGGWIRLGALTTFEEMEGSRLLQEKYPALVQAASAVGSPQVRAMGTVGGNSCNGSPAADSPPALMAYGAEVNLVSAQGRRTMNLGDFITHNRETAIRPEEYLESFSLPEPEPASAGEYIYAGLREAMEIDLVNAAVYLSLDQGKVAKARIVLGAVAPRPIRAPKAEEMLSGQEPSPGLIEQAADQAAQESSPINDFRASAGYRRYTTALLVKKALNRVASKLA